MDMISKLHFRLAPPSADETLHCLSSLLHNSWPSRVPVSDVLSTGACYLKKARARTCWFRHSPYTLAVAALATAYNSLGLGQLKRRLLLECDARARSVTGRGVDLHGVAACAEAMSIDERAAAAAAAAAAASRGGRGGTESPVCNKAAKEGWGSPTGVAQGAELMQEAAFSTVKSVPLVKGFSPSKPNSFSPCAVPKAARAAAAAGAGAAHVGTSSSAPLAAASASASPRAAPPRQAGQKRGFHQSFGSCFVPCGRRRCLEGSVGGRRAIETGGDGRTSGEEG